MLAKHSRATDVHLAPVLSHLATDCESKPPKLLSIASQKLLVGGFNPSEKYESQLG